MRGVGYVAAIAAVAISGSGCDGGSASAQTAAVTQEVFTHFSVVGKFVPTDSGNFVTNATYVFSQFPPRAGVFLSSDLTDAGTSLLMWDARILESDPATWNGKVLISAGAQDNDEDAIWITDGTIAGTKLLVELEPGPLDFHIVSATIVGDRLIITGNAYDPAAGLFTPGPAQVISVDLQQVG